MTNKYMYFIANWKMFGSLNSLNSLHKVIKFFKIFKKNKLSRIIYCPPSTLISQMSKKLKKYKVLYGGSVNPENIKKLKLINNIDGFLIGGASQNPNKFIDIIKKTYI